MIPFLSPSLPAWCSDAPTILASIFVVDAAIAIDSVVVDLIAAVGACV